MLTHTLNHLLGQCELYYGQGFIKEKNIARALCGQAHQIVIITDTTVAPLYAQPLLDQLRAMNQTAHLIAFPSGEPYKTRETKAHVEDQMLDYGISRDALILAVGGGVVTDMAGFIASSFCRGIPSVYVPTTFLSMVDAAVGGKTGVNTKHGKNLIGHFHQPQSVWFDVDVLQSLTQDSIHDGWAETIKHALIYDQALFDYIEKFFQKSADPNIDWVSLVSQSTRIKCDIVHMDEYESLGNRQWLNFGHTVAHALERELKYTISHGQAVLAGLWVESHLSMQMNLLHENQFQRIDHLLEFFTYSTPIRINETSVPQLLEHMKLDKKSSQGKAHFVLLDAIGKAYQKSGQCSFAMNEALIQKSLQEWLKKNNRKEKNIHEIK